jgi:hypothetical protein
VKALAEVANPVNELALDEGVHVFVRTIDEGGLTAAALQDVIERGGNHFGLSVIEDSETSECFNPREAAGDVVFEQPLVKPEGRPELEGGWIGFARESS